MGALTNLRDGLINVLSGRGTSIDRGAHNFWHFVPKTHEQIEAAYRSSWLIAKIVDLPAMDMVREWREWELDAEEVAKVEAEEQRLGIVEAILAGLVYGRLGGGVVILGSGTDMAAPARSSDKLLYVKALPRRVITLGDIDWDVTSEGFGEPAWFSINGQRGSDRIHPSRVIVFKGERVPNLSGLSTEDAFWGDSTIDRVDQAVKNANIVADGFAGLVDEAKLDIYRIAGMAEKLMQPDGEEFMKRRFEATAIGKSNWRGVYLDKDDEWQTRQLTWAGMPEMIRAYLSIVAGAADIPATRLLGKAPDGMNATGEGDEKNYRSTIATKQNMTLRPALQKLDRIMLPSLGIKADAYWKFSPLDTPTEKEVAEIEKLEAETYSSLATSSLVPIDALSKSVQARMVDSGRWPELKDELDKLPDLPDGGEDEDDPSALVAGAKGGDPSVSAGMGGSGREPPRRAANDHAIANMQALMDAADHDPAFTSDMRERMRAIMRDQVAKLDSGKPAEGE